MRCVNGKRNFSQVNGSIFNSCSSIRVNCEFNWRKKSKRKKKESIHSYCNYCLCLISEYGKENGWNENNIYLRNHSAFSSWLHSASNIPRNTITDGHKYKYVYYFVTHTLLQGTQRIKIRFIYIYFYVYYNNLQNLI